MATTVIWRRIALFALIIGIVAVPLPAQAARHTFDNAQLLLLFSGSEVDGGVRRACLENDEPSRVLSLDWTFKFNADGTLSIRYICNATYQPVDRSETGTWWVQNNELCVDSESDIFIDYIHDGIECWPVKKGNLFFEGMLPDSNTYWYFKISNPKYSSKKSFWRHLKKFAGRRLLKPRR